MYSLSRRSFITKIGSGALALSVSPIFSRSTDSLFKTGYIYDPRYLQHVLYPGHPESPERLIAIEQLMRDSCLIQDVTSLAVNADPLLSIHEIHTPEHIASIQNLPTTGAIAELAVAGVLTAINAVHSGTIQNAFCAIRPPGHHAHDTGSEEGFCFYNNVAIAARYIQKVLGYTRVLIVDWDYHHGNATQDSFYSDPTVLFFSTHNWQAYPGTGDPAKQGEGAGLGFNINVHLDSGAVNDDIIRAFEEKLIAKAESFQPEFVLISAGFDSRIDDTLGTFAITDYGFSRITRIVRDIAQQFCNNRLVSLLEGGYNTEGLARAVITHIGTLHTGIVQTKKISPSYNKKAIPVIKNNCIVLPAHCIHASCTITLYSSQGKALQHLNIPSIIQTTLPIITKDIAAGTYYLTLSFNDHESYTLDWIYRQE